MNKDLISSRFDDVGVEVTKNKYFDIYCEIVSNKRISKKEKGEVHHIIPRSLGGTDDVDNLVKISIRHHFVLHKCLARFLHNEPKAKMTYALNRFVGKLSISSRDLETIRSRMADVNKNRTHFTNQETGEIVFALQSPGIDWIKGNKHGKLPWFNSKTNEQRYTKESPGVEWEAGRKFIGKRNSTWWYSPTTDRYFMMMQDEITPDLIKQSPMKGMRFYKNYETGEICRFSTDMVKSGYEPSDHMRGTRVISNPDTLELRYIKSKEQTPEGWIDGNCRPSFLLGKIRVTDANDHTKTYLINPEDFDETIHIVGNLKTRGKVFANKDGETRLFEIDEIPKDWKPGTGRHHLSGWKIYHNRNTRQTKFFDATYIVSDDWKPGNGTDRFWINDGHRNKLISVSSQIPHGFSKGKLADNTHMRGKQHIYNPITLQKKTIKREDEIPEGWVAGLIKKSNPANRGKVTWRNTITNKLEFFDRDFIPDASIYKKGIKP